MSAVSSAPQIISDPAPADAPRTGERINPEHRPMPSVVVAKPVIVTQPETQIEPEPTVLSPWAA
jgi:hypothetical protein